MQEARVHRPCTGNRFCCYKGPLYRERILLAGAPEQVVVGACWFESLRHPGEATRYVCNRCAHRTLFYDAGFGDVGRVWLLRCPACGEPLGRSDAAVLVGAGGAVLARFPALPPTAELQPLIDALQSAVPAYDTTEPSRTLLDAAIEAFRRGEYDRALELAGEVRASDRANRLAALVSLRSRAALGQPQFAQALLSAVRETPPAPRPVPPETTSARSRR